jgi:hypothetical protein
MDAMRFREVTSRALERGYRSWMQRVAQTPEWLRFRILQVRLRIRRAWTLGPRIRQRGLHFTRDQVVGLVGASVGAITVIGLLSGDFRPGRSVHGGSQRLGCALYRDRSRCVGRERFSGGKWQ